MAFIDYYKILGVDKNIPQKDVRKAYLKRTKQFHPDLHPNDPKAKAKFQALNEAYDVINDPEKRKLYDQYGERWREGQAFGGAGGAVDAGEQPAPFLPGGPAGHQYQCRGRRRPAFGGRRPDSGGGDAGNGAGRH